MDKANLTRIRDNQRRSRARRKAYVQELENRLKSFENQGIEVTCAMQKAAQKVDRENILLRTLLHQQGFNDEKINGFIQTSNMMESSPILHNCPRGAGFTIQAPRLLDHPPLQPFDITTHSAICTPESSQSSEEPQSTGNMLLSDHRRISTSSGRGHSKANRSGSESPHSRSPFNFSALGQSSSFSSESSDICSVEYAESSNQIYSPTSNSHPADDEASLHLPNATRTGHSPWPLGLMDHRTEPASDAIFYDSLVAAQLQQGEGTSLGDLALIPSANTFGCDGLGYE
ncbi:hypothetical protein F4810DRAFT_726716 [Camillea tinctor]|nr:hypothetical protein F4810DRAFT_726716 [Camillea tinctor]